MFPRILLILLVLTLQASLIKAQKNPLNVFWNKQQMIEDLDSLQHTLRMYHPGIGRYGDSSIWKNIQEAKDSLPEKASSEEFSALIMELAASVACSHTRALPPSNEMDYYDNTAAYLPFNLIKIGDAYYVNESADETGQLQVGDRIDSINGVACSDWVDSILPLIASDGNTPARKLAAIQTGLYWYSALRFGSDHEFYTVHATRNGQPMQFSLMGVTRVDILLQRQYNASEPTPNVQGYWIRPEIFYLKVSSFAVDDTPEEKKIFLDDLDQIFLESGVDTAQKLILDLRGNTGGLSELGMELCRYLMHDPFIYCHSLQLKTSDISKELPFSPLPSYPGFPTGIRNEKGQILWLKHPALGLKYPQDHRFKGRMLVLCDGACNSTTTEVISVLQDRNHTQFSGENPGGAFVGSNSGITLQLVLPNSQIRVDVPLVAYHIRNSSPYSTVNLQVNYPMEPKPDMKGDPLLKKTIQILED